MISAAYAALWFFVFVLPWENVFVIPGLGTLSKLMGLVAVGCAGLAALFTGRVRHLNAFHILAGIFVAWAGASVFRATYSELAVIKFKTYLQLLAVLWIIWELAPNFKKLRGLMLAYVLGSYVAALITIVLRPQENGHMGSRFTAEGFDPNDLGMTLALALPMAWYLGMTYQRPLLRWVCRGYLLVGVVALGLTGSRGAMVASMTALLIVPWTLTQVSAGKKIAAVFILLAAGVAGLALVPASNLERLGSTGQEVEAGTLNGRLQIWVAGVHAFVEKPGLGYGIGQFEPAIIPWYGRARVAHNSYLAVLVEEGAIGFTVWLLMYLTVFFQALKLPLMERRLSIVLIATAAVAMLPLSWDDRKPVWFLAGMLISLSASMRTQTVVASVTQPVPMPVIPASPAARAARRPASIRARALPPSRGPRRPRGSTGNDA
jgi:O-antigen ligase